jgi:tetratricopeptide (TPR) repeat protein
MKHELAAARLPPTHDQPSETVRVGPKGGSGVRRPSHQSGVRYSPESLHRRRNEQIERKLEEARNRFEAGQIDEARAACEEALFIDPQLPAAVQLMADIAGQVEKRQVALLVDDARAALARGQLDLARERVNEAAAVRPTATDVIQLLTAIETASREEARARQVQDALDQARALLAGGAFEPAMLKAGEVLALDPGNAAAIELQGRARDSLEAIRLETERNLQAEFVLAEARALQERGDRDAAIAALAAFPHQHDEVAALLAALRRPPPTPDPAPAPVEPVVPLVPRSDDAPSPLAVSAATPAPIGPAAEDLLNPPPRPAAAPPAARRRTETVAPIPPPAASSWTSGRTIAAATVGLVAVGSLAAFLMRGGGPAPTQPPPITKPAVPPTLAPANPPRPVSPAPRVVDDAIQTQNDDDATAAFQLLYKGRLDEAAAILARIRKRDPNYNGLRNLEEALALARKSDPAPRKPGP